MLLRSGVVPLRLAIAFSPALSVASCGKKRGKAVVVAKEHIDVAEIKPSPSPGAPSANEESVDREIAPDEIDVDGIVMKKEVRGTSKDPRASSESEYTGTVWGSEIED